MTSSTSAMKMLNQEVSQEMSQDLLLEKIFFYLGMVFASFLVAIGTVWAFERGGGDFNVFYEAGRLVLSGRGLEIFHATPDRFLYFPGFAWVVAPLALLPRDIALAVWCFFKAGVLGWTLREVACFFGNENRTSNLTVGFWSVLLIARPVLIDFQYGQVNLFIMCFCCLTLLHFIKKTNREHVNLWDGWKDVIYWGSFVGASLLKLFPLPLVFLPWLIQRSREKILVLVFVAFFLGLPCWSVGMEGLGQLYKNWHGAILSRGMPLDSHNQSFSAFLYRFFGGFPTPVLAQGSRPISYTILVAPLQVLQKWVLVWTLFWLGIFFGVLFQFECLKKSKNKQFQWFAVIIALMLPPLHLIWKPYFVFTLPIIFILLRSYRSYLPLLLVSILILNIFGLDLFGRKWVGLWEATSAMMWVHVFLVISVMITTKKFR